MNILKTISSAWQRGVECPLWQQLLIILTVGFLTSAFVVNVFKDSDSTFNNSGYFGDSGQYIRPGLGFFYVGSYARYNGEGWEVGDGPEAGHENANSYSPELTMLPGFPIFIAGVFKLFGAHNLLAIVYAQCVLAGLIAVAVGLLARAFRESWTLPAGLLATVWPNLIAWASLALSETLFVFFTVWGATALVWALKGRHLVLLIIAAGLCFGGANLTRHVLTFFSILVIPALAYALWTSGCKWWKAGSLAVLPLAMAYLIYSPVALHMERYTGHFSFSHPTQLEYMHKKAYPCLATKWGCGKPSQALHDRAVERFNAKIKQLPESEQKNRYVMARTKYENGVELILTLPLSQVITASIGAVAKGMLHTCYYDIIRRQGFDTIHLSQGPDGNLSDQLAWFVGAVAATPYMWPWALFQVLLLLSRLVQAVGLVSGLANPQFRPAMILLASMALSYCAIMVVGIGNFRYRAPVEPFLILCLVMGVAQLKEYWVHKSGTLRGANAGITA